MGARGYEGGYEHVQVDRREHVVGHQLVMGLDAVFGQGTVVLHIDLVTVQPLAKLTLNGVDHEFGQGTLSGILGE